MGRNGGWSDLIMVWLLTFIVKYGVVFSDGFTEY